MDKQVCDYIAANVWRSDRQDGITIGTLYTASAEKFGIERAAVVAAWLAAEKAEAA